MKYILRCLSSIISMVLRLCLFMRKLRSKIRLQYRNKSTSNQKIIHQNYKDEKHYGSAENSSHKED